MKYYSLAAKIGGKYVRCNNDQKSGYAMLDENGNWYTVSQEAWEFLFSISHNLITPKRMLQVTTEEEVNKEIEKRKAESELAIIKSDNLNCELGRR